MAYVIAQHSVESSNLAAVGYDARRHVLAVTFKSGAVFHYADVSDNLAGQFFTAESKGRFYAANVRGKFAAQKMTGPCPKCGDDGLIGTRCMDCGCDDYGPAARPVVVEGERGGRVASASKVGA